jgi:hypothetical protein
MFYFNDYPELTTTARWISEIFYRSLLRSDVVIDGETLEMNGIIIETIGNPKRRVENTEWFENFIIYPY